MTFRPRALGAALILTAAGQGLTLAPASAAATDPVTDLTVTQSQGPDHSWVVAAQWTANPDAADYRVAITDHADGSLTPGAYYDSRDVTGSSTTLHTDKLVTGHHYWVTVRSLGDTEGAPTSTAFDAEQLDTTGPVGTFHLSRSSGYLTFDLNSMQDAPSATFGLTQTSLSDDQTPADQITRKVEAGDGTAAKAWVGPSYSLVYRKAGTFTPHVVLTDGHGNVATVDLAPVTVRVDRIPPTIHVVQPPKASRNRVSAWTSIHGLASDKQTGVQIIGAFVAEKRGTRWWVYDFDSRRWMRGTTKLSTTEQNSNASPAFPEVRKGVWRAPKIAGMTKGTLYVDAIAIDGAGNFGEITPISHKLTRP